MTSRDEPEQVAARVGELEILLTHQQRLVEELNEVILTQHRRIDALELQVSRLTRELESLTPTAEARKLEDDKPPHY